MKQKEIARYGMALFQLVGTLGIMFLVQNTLLATALLFVLWFITFYPFSKFDVVLFLSTSVIFTLVDISVLYQGVFAFADKDIAGMPYFELFLWGFYFLNAHRLLRGDAPPRLVPGLIFSVLIMAVLSLMPSVSLSLLAAAMLLIFVIIFYFKTRKDVQYTFYLLSMGLVIEYLGTTTGKWSYAIDNYLYWWMVTWAVSGLILYRTMLPLTQIIINRFLKK
jgi:hypothetical protein